MKRLLSTLLALLMLLDVVPMNRKEEERHE